MEEPLENFRSFWFNSVGEPLALFLVSDQTKVRGKHRNTVNYEGLMSAVREAIQLSLVVGFLITKS